MSMKYEEIKERLIVPELGYLKPPKAFRDRFGSLRGREVNPEGEVLVGEDEVVIKYTFPRKELEEVR